MANTPRFATATYADVWAGNVPCFLTSFKTKRRGETVTRYRWQREDGLQAHHWVAPFQTVDGAIAAAQRHACFSSIQRVGA